MSLGYDSFAAAGNNSAAKRDFCDARSNPHTAASSTSSDTSNQLNTGAKFFERLSTYKKWPPTAQLRPTTLAAAGFSYIGLMDETECRTCSLIHTNWQMGNNPLDFHIREGKDCPLAKINQSRCKSRIARSYREREIERGSGEEVRYGEVDLSGSSAHGSVTRARGRHSTQTGTSSAPISVMSHTRTDDVSSGMTTIVTSHTQIDDVSTGRETHMTTESGECHHESLKLASFLGGLVLGLGIAVIAVPVYLCCANAKHLSNTYEIF